MAFKRIQGRNVDLMRRFTASCDRVSRRRDLDREVIIVHPSSHRKIYYYLFDIKPTEEGSKGLLDVHIKQDFANHPEKA